MGDDGKVNMDVRTIIVTLVVGAIGFIVGLQWQNAFQTTLREVEKSRDKKLHPVTDAFLSAIIVTCIMILLAYFIVKMVQIGQKAKGNSHINTTTTSSSISNG